ncbi:MAG: response regulator transcription factor [Geitlerinemataceae cyanobacterium]
MIRVLLVDDQAILCQVLETWLEREADLEVVGTAHDSQSAIEQVEILKPDIVLLDIQMPGMDGIAATQIICQRFPTTKVIVLSGYDSDTYLSNAVRAGAKGYLLKNTAAEDLVNTIRSVQKGYSQMGPGLVDKMMAHVSSSDEGQGASETPEAASRNLMESELRFLLERFESQALVEFVNRSRDEQSAAHLFARVTGHLRNQPTNLAALYLAGGLAHRHQGQTISAFQYLRFGFKEGIKQGLSSEDLLLFYREGVRLKPEDSFAWLTPVKSLWDNESGLSFLLEEADRLFGKDSSTYQTLFALWRIGKLWQLDSEFTAIGERLKTLQQGFDRLDAALAR